MPGTRQLRRARQVLDIEIEAIRSVRRQLDARFTAVVGVICDALVRERKVVVVGIGKSGAIGRKIAATFSSTGTTSVVLDPVDALHGDLGIVAGGDVILALSYSGESEELIHLLPALKQVPGIVVAMTGNVRSTLARHADHLLPTRVPREACPFNLAPTASTTAMLALGDALAMAVLEARGFRKQDFARRHPSGAIGRALLLRVSDIMRSGARLAVVPATTRVQEALFVMTRAKAGSVAVVDSRGRLAGVFTDGDLRRHMAADTGVLGLPIRQVMTRNPVVIREDALAADAVRVFNERKIDDLVVVNARREPVGLVDSQDLPRLKLV